MKKIGLVMLVLVLLSAVAGATAWQRYQSFLDTPLILPANGMVVSVADGATGQSIIRMLAEQGITKADWGWRLLMKLQPRVYRAGEFRLEAGMKPEQVLQVLASDEVISYRFTIVEGWTARQMLQAISADPVLEHTLPEDPAEALQALQSELGLDHAEGWFMPETYVFTRGDSDRDVLLRAHESMKETLASAWQSRNTGIPLESEYELLTLASIIEKETAQESERTQIAGVFVRRLNKGMRLQTDPTVIYGLGDAFDGDIRRRDLTTDTPYNTYTRHGLPPTPIALPGSASLFAAAAPADGETLYFVADGKGGHTFSVTLKEHQAAVRKYLESRG